MELHFKQLIMDKQRIIIGVSGATGIRYAITMLRTLRELNIETHMIVSSAAERTRAFESSLSMSDLRNLADFIYKVSDIGAAIASGSFKTMGMVIVPCSVKTLAEIATGVTGNLLSRAADVVLKERRRLVLMVRETPLHTGHIKNMLTVSEYGGIIAPPVPAFYTNPHTIEDIIEQTTGRILDLFGLDASCVQRWQGQKQTSYSIK